MCYYRNVNIRTWITGVFAGHQELKGRFLIKGKSLKKLEDYFSDQVATAEEECVTEEEDSRDDEELGHSENKKVCEILVVFYSVHLKN